jgi:hypothetical protein
MDIFGYSSHNIFDQNLNTYDDVYFSSVEVTDQIVLPQQLATKLYVDNSGGGGAGGNMTYTGGGSIANKIYKSQSANGLSATFSSLSDDGSTVVSNASNGFLADKFVKQGGTSIQYLMGDGSTLTQSANSGTSNFYLFDSSQGAGLPPIANGTVKYNNANQSLATVIYISHVTRDSVDIEIFFQQITTISQIYLQDQTNSSNYIRYDVSSNPTIVANQYVSIPVIVQQGAGTGLTSFGNNHDILVSFFTNSLEVDTRLSALETKTAQQSASGLVTSFNDRVVVALLQVQSISSFSGSPQDSVNIGTGDFRVSINSLNGIRSNKFEILNGLSSQFLKADGSVDSNTYATTSSLASYLPLTGGTLTGVLAMGSNKVTSSAIPTVSADLCNKTYVDSLIVGNVFTGYIFNPLQNSTLLLTSGNKSYFYTVRIQRPTIISGFSIYIGSGSDPVRFAVYRGWIRGSPLNNSIIAGTSLSTPASTGLPMLSGSITPVVGQNLSFTTGEYMIIAFSSNGSTNSFYASPTQGSPTVDIGFSSTSNFVSSGFPTTLNTTSQSAALTNKLCFELY